MNQKYQKLIDLLGKDKIKVDEPLANYTTYKIGGPADLFIQIESEEALVRTIEAVKKTGVPYFILGNGSNILVGDKGFRGIVIKIQNSKFKIQKSDSKVIIYAEAGMALLTLLDQCRENSLSGLEFVAGIPGTVGGAVRGNAGAWQQNISDKILRVKILFEDRDVLWIDKDNCSFSYRNSRFKSSDEIILGVEFELAKEDTTKIVDLTSFYLTKRLNQPKEPSAGCVFVNPKPQSAGQLIDACGLKGRQVGGAKISEEHANFFINTGGAKASELSALINLAKQKVKEKFYIDLQEEIVRIGEF